MAKIELNEKKTDVRQDFEPIVLENGTKVSFHKNVVNGSRNFFGEAEKDGKTIGRVSFGDDTKRLFLSVETWDALGDAAAKELADTLYKGIVLLLNS